MPKIHPSKYHLQYCQFTIASIFLALIALQLEAQIPPPFELTWGSTGSDDGQFDLPVDLAIDSSGNVYVTEQFGHRIQKFDSSGNFILKWGTIGTGEGEFFRPEGVVVDSSGNVYVADSGNHRIQKFDSSGIFLLEWGTNGSGDEQFEFPRAIAVDISGNVYVGELVNHRIQKFDSSGNFLLNWDALDSGDGQFLSPRAIVVDISGNLFVAESNTNRILKFDSSGSFLLKLGIFGIGDGQFFNPRGIAVDISGNVYVADTANSRIQKFDSNLNFLLKWDSQSIGDGQLFRPTGVAVDDLGNVFVAAGSSILKFSGPDLLPSDDATSVNEGGTVSVLEDGAISVLVNDLGFNLNVTTTGVMGTANGNVDINGDGTFTYTHDGSETTTDSFTYEATDGAFTALATVNITINPINDPPVAVGDTVEVLEGGSISTVDGGATSILANDSDPDLTGDILTVVGNISGTATTHGTISIDSDGNFTYIHDGSETTTDSFTYEVTDGMFMDSATVNIVIILVNEILEDPPPFELKWGINGGDGTSGSGDGEFSLPRGVAVEITGNVYVADQSNHRIQKFDSSGNFLRKWGRNGGDGTSGSGDGEFSSPTGIAVESSGNVYVVDTGNRRIQKFDSSGVFITKWGTIGSGDGQFELPTGIAVDNSGNVYVSDISIHRIQKFDSSGSFLLTWGKNGGGNGELSFPFGLAVDSSGNVYVAELENNRVQKFDNSGNFLLKWGKRGGDNGQFSDPTGIALDSLDNVYVADQLNHRVQKFNSTGNFHTIWGVTGSEEGQFDRPFDLAVDSSGNVYVTDLSNHRIQKFSTISTMVDVFWGESIVDFPAWRTSFWYKNYNVEFWPWIFHDEHGWQFVSDNSTEEVIFLWDLGLGEWLFFNENTYRWLFMFGTNGDWIFTFEDNTPDSRFFQRGDDGSLFSIPAGLPVE